MKQCFARVSAVEAGDPRQVVLTVDAPAIAQSVKPGQFLNVLVNDAGLPFLRRPFSVYMTNGTELQILFNVVGAGTALLAGKKPGDQLDLLGPLGRPFSTGGSFETAILVGGGLGVAALPLLARELAGGNVPLLTFLGARDAGTLVERYLPDALVATDDGSRGFRGTVVEYLRSYLNTHKVSRPKVFACGPTQMLRALSTFTLAAGIPCDISLESAMACGIGICQGCPVELAGAEKKYALVCRDGTVFDAHTLRWE